MKVHWVQSAKQFIASMRDEALGGYRSAPRGITTLYGTVYGLLARYYLGEDIEIDEATIRFIQGGQDLHTGLFLGPELQDFHPVPNALHDIEHLRLHLTCAVLPACSQFKIPVLHRLAGAETFCNLDYLRDWLSRRDLRKAWWEGNNLLFAGQLLVYLRDVQRNPLAQPALDLWFGWLDQNMDSATSLWGSNGKCPMTEAVYGGYHQLLVYYHEEHPVINPTGLVDAVLDLQHSDGGFHPRGNAGACEDVDSVDILVNLYKQNSYRRNDIRSALRKCLHHILTQQNPDGGFPYTRNRPQNHTGIPRTAAPPNVSCMFPTWFRIHTLALMAEILPDEPKLGPVPFRFSQQLSMGWHHPWSRKQHQLDLVTSGRERWNVLRWRGERRIHFFQTKLSDGYWYVREAIRRRQGGGNG